MHEIKRKIFHHLSLVYLFLYALLPRWLSIPFLGLVLALVGALEFLRLRRPEINAWLIGKFGGIHRESEVMSPSGIFWTLLGCWLTMIIFVDKLIGVTGIGYLVFGDTAAALVGKIWGRHPWKKNPTKTMEGSAAFAGISLLWGLLMVRPHGALVGALFTAWVESLSMRVNDNLWIPLAGAFSVSVCFGGKLIEGNPYVYLLGRTFLFSLVFAAAAYALMTHHGNKPDAA
jgi:dolichol kinase